MIAFIGLSHLGIVYSAATAANGFEVVGFAPDAALCAHLGKGDFPILEPKLPEIFSEHRSRIRYTSDVDELRDCELVLFALDVATDERNYSNLAPLRELIAGVSGVLAPQATVVILSQVPPGFMRSAQALFGGRALFYQVETLVFGDAIERAQHPERCIIGCARPSEALPAPYERWLSRFACPVLRMGYESAELTKIAINLFLISSVSTTNTLAEICEKIGADWKEMVPALRLDKRIGAYAYLTPGLGLSGGNLERDLVTIKSLADENGADTSTVQAWQANSRYRRDWVLRLVHEHVIRVNPHPTLAIWGLAYKAHTHSIKNSPAIALLEALAPFDKVAYDPEVNLDLDRLPRTVRAQSALEACRGADGLVVMTPWPEFGTIPAEKLAAVLKCRLVIDPFGALDERSYLALGFEYFRLGKS